jgi:pimeloyl-ACP methyl ester carboxylesterase
VTRSKWRSLLGKGLLGVSLLCAASALVEHVLEVQETARLTANDTFYPVDGKQVRYHLTGAGAPGPTIVLICGMMASFEQWDDVQTQLGTFAPVIAYDRGGMGFSDGSSEAHDAKAQADELDALLHAPGLAPPFVLVSFSSGSVVARIFAAEHPDLVKGLVFVDPMVPEASEAIPASRRVSYLRKFIRLVVRGSVESLFGVLRLQRLIARRHEPPPSPLAERTDAVLWSYHHWRATTRDVLDLQRSADEAIAAPWFGNSVPVGVLSATNPDESELTRLTVVQQHELAAKSAHGIFKAAGHLDHGKILNNPAVSRFIVDLTRTIVTEARDIPGAAPPP